jgi:site-specific DNA-cytosine methylase
VRVLPRPRYLPSAEALAGNTMPSVVGVVMAMAFIPEYVVLGNKRRRVRQLGNAVTPPVAEILVAALVETLC